MRPEREVLLVSFVGRGARSPGGGNIIINSNIIKKIIFFI